MMIVMVKGQYIILMESDLKDFGEKVKNMVMVLTYIQMEHNIVWSTDMVRK